MDAQASFTPENIYFQKDRVRQVFGVKLAITAPGGYAKAPIDFRARLTQTQRAAKEGTRMTRIDAKFPQLKAEGRKASVAYVMAGDPDYETSLQVVLGLPGAGVDIIAALRSVARRGPRGPMVEVRRPSGGKDWNDVLCSVRGAA